MTRDEILSEIRRLAGAGDRLASDAFALDGGGNAPVVSALEAVARVTATGGEGSGSLDALTAQIAELRQAVTLQKDKVEENSRATAENTSARLRDVAQAGRDFLDDLRGRSGLGSALLASPLIGAVTRLFRRNTPAQPEPLPAFQAPAALQVEAALAGEGADGLLAVAPAQGGELRTVERAPQAAVTVQVQTMDSRSFLDNSDQIARAVREALLNMHSLSDVVGDI